MSSQRYDLDRLSSNSIVRNHRGNNSSSSTSAPPVSASKQGNNDVKKLSQKERIEKLKQDEKAERGLKLIRELERKRRRKERQDLGLDCDHMDIIREDNDISDDINSDGEESSFSTRFQSTKGRKKGIPMKYTKEKSRLSSSTTTTTKTPMIANKRTSYHHDHDHRRHHTKDHHHFNSPISSKSSTKRKSSKYYNDYEIIDDNNQHYKESMTQESISSSISALTQSPTLLPQAGPRGGHKTTSLSQNSPSPLSTNYKKRRRRYHDIYNDTANNYDIFDNEHRTLGIANNDIQEQAVREETNPIIKKRKCQKIVINDDNKYHIMQVDGETDLDRQFASILQNQVDEYKEKKHKQQQQQDDVNDGNDDDDVGYTSFQRGKCHRRSKKKGSSKACNENIDIDSMSRNCYTERNIKHYPEPQHHDNHDNDIDDNNDSEENCNLNDYLSRKKSKPVRRKETHYEEPTSDVEEVVNESDVGKQTTDVLFAKTNTTKIKHDYDDDDGLWDDSDDDVKKEQQKKKQKESSITTTTSTSKKRIENDSYDDSDDDSKEKRKNTKRNKSSCKKEKPQHSRRGRKGGQRKLINTSSYDDDDDFGEFGTEEEMLKVLKPDLDNPKFLFDFKPLELIPPPLAEVANIYDYGDYGNGENNILRDQKGHIRHQTRQHQVPASMNRYLTEYQKDGVEFMYHIVSQGRGVILGDDMGLGKTVQCISLLAALQEKTGTKKDLKDIKDRWNSIEKQQAENMLVENKALEEGKIIIKSEDGLGIGERPYAPILIVVPSSVIDNWAREFKKWGHFSVSAYSSGTDRANSIHRIKIGMDDIMLCAKTLFGNTDFLQIKWKLIVVDEFHEYKNRKTQGYSSLEALRNDSQCPIIGMTGTVMPNELKELWTLVDLVQPGILGDWKNFNQNYNKPIKLARTNDAKSDVLELGREREEELQKALKNVYLHRNKSQVLEDELTTKRQKVMFCKLTNIQKKIYEEVLKLPEYELLRKCNSPCDCGVNVNFFSKYKKLHTIEEKRALWRRFKNKIVKRKECCYKGPFEPGTTKVMKGAVFWPAQHPDEQHCKTCPHCILLPMLQKLYNICSHASMLQVKKPEQTEKEDERARAEKDLAFAKLALKPDVLRELPGQTYFRNTSLLTDHQKLSGKMQILAFCLQQFEKNGDRVLIFSFSTATLDFIEEFTKERGYESLRLDGSTPTKKRQSLIDRFQNNPNIFLFLISTKAGGLGLNLTAANKVIIYDVSWNPSNDEQAQDRAFRIGQMRDVDVIRLVAQGTIEELKYLRQIYKQHINQQTLRNDEHTSNQAPRIFKGVSQDNNRKGELFGGENLLQFKDGSFTSALWQSSDMDSLHQKKIDQSELAEMMCGNDDLIANDFVDEHKKDEEALDTLEELLGSKGYNHEDFMREDRGNVASNDVEIDLDKGFGETQLHVMACESVCNDESDEEEKLLNAIGESLGKDTLSVHTDSECLKDNDIRNIDSNDISSSKSEHAKSEVEPVVPKKKKMLKRPKIVKSLLLGTANLCQEQNALSRKILYRPSYL